MIYPPLQLCAFEHILRCLVNVIDTQAMDDIYQRVREAANADGRSAYKLACEAGTDPASILRFMRGERTLRLDRLAKLAAVLGLKIVVQPVTGGA